MTAAIILGLVGAAIVIAAAFFLRRSVASGSGAQTAAIQTEIDNVSKQLEEFNVFADQVASKRQISFLEEQVTQIKNELESEKVRLSDIEVKLESAQKLVEEKESIQQEAKTQLDEDENRIKALIEVYESLSAETIAIERKLAVSMKDLEAMIEDAKVAELTEDQKSILNDLMTQLTDTGANLRELITEYESVHQRITGLNQQHKDLEDEYTRLVEQQLGE